MSVYSDYSHGAIDYDEFVQLANWETRKDKYLEEKMYEETKRIDEYEEEE